MVCSKGGLAFGREGQASEKMGAGEAWKREESALHVGALARGKPVKVDKKRVPAQEMRKAMRDWEVEEGLASVCCPLAVAAEGDALTMSIILNKTQYSAWEEEAARIEVVGR